MHSILLLSPWKQTVGTQIRNPKGAVLGAVRLESILFATYSVYSRQGDWEMTPSFWKIPLNFWFSNPRIEIECRLLTNTYIKRLQSRTKFKSGLALQCYIAYFMMLQVAQFFSALCHWCVNIRNLSSPTNMYKGKFSKVWFIRVWINYVSLTVSLLPAEYIWLHMMTVKWFNICSRAREIFRIPFGLNCGRKKCLY